MPKRQDSKQIVQKMGHDEINDTIESESNFYTSK